MSDTAETDWQTLSKKAMRTRAGFEALLLALEPALLNSSRQYCPIDPESAAQEARMWLYTFVYVQKRVNLSLSSNTIGTFLRTSAKTKIMNVARKLNKKGMRSHGLRGEKGPVPRPDIVPLDHYAALNKAISTEDDEPLPFPLEYYADYFEEHGTLNGAAAWCEEKFGYDKKKIDAAFRRVVASMKR